MPIFHIFQVAEFMNWFIEFCELQGSEQHQGFMKKYQTYSYS